MRRVYTQRKIHYPGTLHRFVFSCVYVKYTIVFLFTAFILQPIAPIFAAEIEGEGNISEVQTPSTLATAVAKSETHSDQEQKEVSIVASEGELVSMEEESIGTVSLTESKEKEIIGKSSDKEKSVESLSVTTIQEESESADETVVSSSTNLSHASSSDSIDSSNVLDTNLYTTEVATTTDTVSEFNTNETATATDVTSYENISEVNGGQISATQSEETLDSTDEVTNEETDNSEVSDDLSITEQSADELVSESNHNTMTNSIDATSSIEIDPAVLGTTTATSNQNRHQFSKDECVSMGDGSFFCSKPGDIPEYMEDGVFSIPDADGDMEIVVRVGGKERFITDNQVDDMSPYYDGISERIVWHTLKNDRYQIVSYDFETDKTQYITDTRYNNMEPVAFGENTLWQAWVVNNWEIMLYDGSTTTQLTDNTMNDIAPQVRGGYVLWQTQFADGWKVALYDQETGMVEYIGDAEGALAANPRFVLVYDSLDENGDVRTVGFDLDSGEVVPFSQIPSQLPDRLPEPQGSEETRALIQNKSNSKNENQAKNSSSTASSTSLTASSTDALSESTLDLTTPASSTASSTNQTVEDVVVMSDREKAEQSVDDMLKDKLRSSSTSHIEDVIIPPLATSTDEVME